MMKLLIDNGADVNHANNLGFTPLHRAAQKGNGGKITYYIK